MATPDRHRADLRVTDELLFLLSTAVAIDQETMASLLGYGTDVEAMNEDHDALHDTLAHVFGYRSVALEIAAGEDVAPPERILAGMEEVTVLCLQRLLQHWKAQP